MSNAEDLLVVRARVTPRTRDLWVILVEEGKVVSVARAGHHGIAFVEIGAILEHHLVSTESEAISKAHETDTDTELINTMKKLRKEVQVRPLTCATRHLSTL